MGRWLLPGWLAPEKQASDTALVQAHCQLLRNRVAPRVQAAVVSTLFNRWTTERRFQKAAIPCRLCHGGEDSVERYLRCRVVRDFAASRLALHYAEADAWPLLLMVATPDYVSDTPETWARVALLLYTAYRTVNSIKHSDSPLSEEDTTRALSQALTEAVSGHPASSSLLVTPWLRQVRRRR